MMIQIRSSPRGFTLVEVLVAIAIFAVLSASGWLVFDHLIKNRTRNVQHGENLQAVQFAYSQMLRDFGQMVPKSGLENDQPYPALQLTNDRVAFHKSGVIDPLKQGLDEFEFVEYRYDTQRQAIMRYKNSYLYRRQMQDMQGDVVLSPVENVRFQVLDPALQSQWPAENITTVDAGQYILSQLPKGVELSFSYQSREYQWLFAVATQALVIDDENKDGENKNNVDDKDKKEEKNNESSSSE